MTTTKRRHPIASFLLTLAVVLLVVGLVFLEWRYPRPINITRSEFELARTQWKSWNVSEYEITIYSQSFPGGTFTFHVSEYGNKVSQLSPAARHWSTLTEREHDRLKRYTIEGRFERVAEMLDELDAPDTTAREVNAGNEFVRSGYIAYKILFDAWRGYPWYLAEIPVDYDLSDVDRTDTVTSFKVIR